MGSMGDCDWHLNTTFISCVSVMEPAIEPVKN